MLSQDPHYGAVLEPDPHEDADLDPGAGSVQVAAPDPGAISSVPVRQRMRGDQFRHQSLQGCFFPELLHLSLMGGQLKMSCASA
jgi:hypothetical protein